MTDYVPEEVLQGIDDVANNRTVSERDLERILK